MGELIHFPPEGVEAFRTQGPLAFQPEPVVQPSLHLIAKDGVLVCGEIIQFPRENQIGGETIIFKYTYPETDVFQEQVRVESKVFPENATLTEHIDYFDRYWQEQGLPQDWYNLKKKVGFSMNSEMRNLLSTDPEDVAVWVRKAKLNLGRFSLEYLTRHIVYPQKYEIDRENNKLYDPRYSDQDVTEITSPDERNGSVLRAVTKVKRRFLSKKTPNGAISVIPSPLGPTGLKTDNNKLFDYPDSYFIVMEKQGEIVMNYTIKTDFNLAECRAVIKALTKTHLPVGSSLEAYVDAIATINPHESTEKIKSVFDVVKVLQEVRAETSPENAEFAFEETKWQSVYDDIVQGEALYELNAKAKEVLKGFEEYCSGKKRTILELRKALAATFLRLSRLFLDEEKDGQVAKPTQYASSHSRQRHDHVERLSQRPATFGEVLDEVAKRPGCAGGGKKEKTLSTSLIDRLGEVSFGEQRILCCKCPFCNEKVEAVIANGKITCPNPKCGKSAPYQEELEQLDQAA